MSAPEIRTIGVVGLGAMGGGIAQLAIEAGYDVVGREVTDELGHAARSRIAHFLQRKVDKERMTAAERDAALARLSTTTDLADLGPSDVVIEAIVEDLGTKRALFAELEGIVRPDAVLATNTSALSVTEIAASVGSPERVVGMHFFNPAPLMPLVEIVRAELSSDDAVEAAFGVGERMGKRPIRCHDTPGFVVNRILIPLLNDCLRVLDEARVSPEELDTAMTAGAGWPMGPCTLVDLVGIDVHVHASEALYEKLREPRMAPPPRIVATSERQGRECGQAYSLLTRLSRRSHGGGRYWAGVMRMLVLSACLAALGLAVGGAYAAEPDAGTLSVERGKGVVMLDLRGSILGRLSAGSLRVTDQTPGDRFSALVFGRRVTQERIGPRTVVYRGQGLRFRMLGGGYRVVVRGSGMDISAVGKGVAVLDGEPRLGGDDAGVYSLDGVDCGLEPELCLPLPLEPTRYTLGSPDEGRSSGKVTP